MRDSACTGLCATGRWGLAGANSSACSGACDRGFYCLAGSTSAQANQCPAGRFGSSTGLASAECTGLCDAGRWGAPGATTSACAGACDPGFYCEAGSISARAIPCPAGKYGSLAGLTNASCTGLCDAGRWGDSSASVSACSGACDRGFYCLAGSTSAQANQCPAGRFGSSTGLASAECTGLCDAGRWGAPGATASACTGACDPGFYCLAGSTLATANACPVGRFGNVSGLATAECSGRCALGTWSNATGLTMPECIPCAAGSFCSTTLAQVDCPAGAFCPARATAAVICPLGAYCERQAANWTACPVGYYADRTGRPDATCSGACPAGRYGATTGLAHSNCTALCPAGRWGAPGAMTPDCSGACKPGYYCEAGAVSALSRACPAGRFGDTPGATNAGCTGPCAAGFFCAVGSTSATAGRCPNGTSTAAGAGTKESDCKGEVPSERVEGVAVALLDGGAGGLKVSWVSGQSANGSSSTTGYVAVCQQMRAADVPDPEATELPADVQGQLVGGHAGSRRVATLTSPALCFSYGYRCRVASRNVNGLGLFSDWSLPVQWYVRPPPIPLLETPVQLSRDSNLARYVTVSGAVRSGANGEAIVASDASLRVRYAPASQMAGGGAFFSGNRSVGDVECKGARELPVSSRGLSLWRPNISVDGDWRFSFSVLICDQAPYVFAIQLTNVGGASSGWSGWSAPVATNCSTGTFLAVAAEYCLPCPVGANCSVAAPNASALSPVGGWWRMPWATNASAAFAPCAPLDVQGRSACLQGGGCEEGYGGVLCHGCVSGYARSGAAACSLCSAQWRSWLALIGIAGVALAMLGFLVRATLRSRGEPGRLEVVMLKVLMAHLQTVALASEFDLRWPGWLAGMFAASDAGSSVSDQVLSLDCVLPAASAQHGASVFAGAALVLGSPLVSITGAAMYWAVAHCFAGHADRPRDTLGSAVSSAPAGRDVKQVVLPAADAFKLTVIVLLSTLHASLSKATLRLLTCRPLGARHWLAADLTVECWATDSPHSAYGLPLAVPALLLFVLGIPVGTAAVLWRHRHELAAPRVRAKYGFLYASYRPATYTWDSVVLLRKLAIAAVTVFLRPAGAGLQACAACLVAFVSLALQIQVRPYASDNVNALDTYALLAEVSTFFLSVVLYVSDTDDGLKRVVTVGIGFINLGYTTYFLCVFFRESPIVRTGAHRLSAAVASFRARGPGRGSTASFLQFRTAAQATAGQGPALELTQRQLPQISPAVHGGGLFMVNPLVSQARISGVGKTAAPIPGVPHPSPTDSRSAELASCVTPRRGSLSGWAEVDHTVPPRQTGDRSIIRRSSAAVANSVDVRRDRAGSISAAIPPVPMVIEHHRASILAPARGGAAPSCGSDIFPQHRSLSEEPFAVAARRKSNLPLALGGVATPRRLSTDPPPSGVSDGLQVASGTTNQGWTEHWDQVQGSPYWHCAATGVSAWERPAFLR